MSYHIGLRQLQYFLAVAEELHFRKAAEKVFISQPGLSKQIKDMESSLGILLLERDNRNVNLTAAGQYLKTEIAGQMGRLDQILHNAKLIHDGLKGELKLGYVGSAMQKIIPQLLVEYKKNQEDILFHLNEMDNHIQVDKLIHNQLDLGFVRLQRIPRVLSSYEVLNEPFCLVLPIGHPLEAQSFEDMSQLKNESFILFDQHYSSSYYEKVMQIFDDCRFTPIVSHNTIHSNSIYKLIENGFGVSIVPNSLKTNNLKNIKFIDLDHLPQRTTLSAVWRADNSNPILSQFITAIKAM